MISQPRDSPPTIVDTEFDFSDGATWRCTSCGADQRVGTDDEDEETGLPAHYNPSLGIAVCDACADDGPEGDEPHEYWG